MNSKFHMAGTEGTGAYVVLAKTARGRIGVRVLAGTIDAMAHVDLARVRVEPVQKPATVAKKMADMLPSKRWKQPGEGQQTRFSAVVEGGKKLKDRVVRGLTAIGAGKLKTEVNPEAPKWAKNLVASLSAN